MLYREKELVKAADMYQGQTGIMRTKNHYDGCVVMRTFGKLMVIASTEKKDPEGRLCGVTWSDDALRHLYIEPREFELVDKA